MDYLQTALALQHLVAEYEPRFLALSDEQASRPTGPGRWSRKQLLGHLVDSAVNNHQRFIRLQLAPELRFPGYEQDEWVARNHYAARPWADLVALWSSLNRHLAHVIEHLAPETLDHVWDTGTQRHTLAFLVGDYLVHLRHHATQILDTAP